MDRVIGKNQVTEEATREKKAGPMESREKVLYSRFEVSTNTEDHGTARTHVLEKV